MKERGKEFDVSNQVNVTDHTAVRDEILNLFTTQYTGFDFAPLATAFNDMHRLFTGNFPGYYFCDTAYHDLQHTLDMTLALARLIVGYERDVSKTASFGGKRAMVAIICALYHDSGYIRARKDSKHKNGAEYTKTHVTRSARFLNNYLPSIGLADVLFITNKMVHFTGYELSVDHLTLQDTHYQTLGYMLGSADLMAQMADRCYLEKCRDRLYPEFVLGEVDHIVNKDGSSQFLYDSPEDLLSKTPVFYEQSAIKRLTEVFDGVYEYAGKFFSGKNLYMLEVEQNINYLRHVLAKGDLSLLRRKPLPNMATMATEQQKVLGGHGH